MLDQETGVRGFQYTGQEEFLEPYVTGRAAYEQAGLQVAQAASGDHESVQLAADEDSAARAWQVYAERTITERRANTPTSLAVLRARALQGKLQMDQFRGLNAQLRDRLNARRDATLRNSGFASTIEVVLLAVLFAFCGLATLQRLSKRALSRSELELAYRVRQREFSDLIQAVDTEAEAHELVQRHLRRTLVGAQATVLVRNNSDNRLQPATELGAQSALAEGLVDVEPRSCLAIRLGRSHTDGAGRDELISCRVCTHIAGTATCEPLLVGGKVIGSC